jgi:hypothetical protein
MKPKVRQEKPPQPATQPEAEGTSLKKMYDKIFSKETP